MIRPAMHLQISPKQRLPRQPLSPTLAMSSHILRHEPRKQALTDVAFEAVKKRKKRRRDMEAPGEPDAEVDLAKVQWRSEACVAAHEVHMQVFEFTEAARLLNQSGRIEAPLPRAHNKPKRRKPTVPAWLDKNGKEITKPEAKPVVQQHAPWLTPPSSPDTPPSTPGTPPIIELEPPSKWKKIEITNGEDFLGTNFEFRADCKYKGFIPPASEEHRLKTLRGTLLGLPNETLEIVAGHVATVSDLNSLSSTCRLLHFMLETWNLKDWLTTSMRDPLCAPFPHAIVASRARDLADWTVHGKGEIIEWMPVSTPRGCEMNDEQRHELLHSSMTHGYFGLMQLAALKIGVQLRHLRLFQLRKKELRPLFDFSIQSADACHIFNRLGLSRDTVNTVCRENAVVNKYTYCELFHHDVENLALKIADQQPGLGAAMRQDWLYYCVPDMSIPDPLPCQNLHRGVDRLMLMNFLGDMGMAWWNDSMQSAYKRRTAAELDRQGSTGIRETIPIDLPFIAAASQAVRVIATNTLDIAFPPANSMALFEARNRGFDIAKCKNSKIDKKISQILALGKEETRLWDSMIGREIQVVDMAEFGGLEHDIWLSVQKH